MTLRVREGATQDICRLFGDLRTERSWSCPAAHQMYREGLPYNKQIGMQLDISIRPVDGTADIIGLRCVERKPTVFDWATAFPVSYGETCLMWKLALHSHIRSTRKQEQISAYAGKGGGRSVSHGAHHTIPGSSGQNNKPTLLDSTRDMRFEVASIHSPQALYGERVSSIHDDLTLHLRRWLFDALCIIYTC